MSFAQIQEQVRHSWVFKFLASTHAFQAVKLTQTTKGATYIEPPSSTWAYTRIKRQKKLHAQKPQTRPQDRVQAASRGAVRAWFEEVEKTVNPAMCTRQTLFTPLSRILLISRIVTIATWYSTWTKRSSPSRMGNYWWSVPVTRNLRLRPKKFCPLDIT